MKLTDAEMRMMKIIWKEEQINSGDLVKICNQNLDWKKSTTYTILKKLVDKHMVKNENAMVSVIVSKQNYDNMQKKNMIARYFSGSLPQFLTTFFREEKLSRDDIQELEEIIKEYKERLDE